MRDNRYRTRRFIIALLFTLGIASYGIYTDWQQTQETNAHNERISSHTQESDTKALAALQTLEIKGRAPKTGYNRSQFGNGWRTSGSCDTRELILARDLSDTSIENCVVYKGTLDDPYTAKTIAFSRGAGTSDDVQIDHVVALSDAWQKGAQALTSEVRENFANDPLELLAVDGQANQTKSDGDAATWLPPNKDFRCRYVARQIAVKQKYSLWVTLAEHDAMNRILITCPDQLLPHLPT